ncbi:MAG: DUF4215 domain-containing protein [Candidatus Binatia bacterium]
MSHATHTCFEAVVAVEQRCRDARLRGETCDALAVEAEVEAATGSMLSAAADACTDGQLTEIGYFGFFDANADLRDACVNQARGAMAAAYAPATEAPSPAVIACMSASAAYGRKVMWFILDRQTPVMERLATRLDPGEDRADVARQVEIELRDTRPRWIDGLLGVCPDFESIYGRTAESFLRTLKQRADCVLSKTYVNNAILCAGPSCGNGIPEGDEECDDGNADDSDACRNDCTQAGSSASAPGRRRAS